MSNFPNGFANGVTIRGVPVDIPNPGEVFWVNNSGVLAKGGIGGSNGNDGSYRKPFSTLDFAVGKCTANRGDVIYVMPGHSETFTAADGVDFDVAGITVIGLGRGSKQPQFKFNHANATIAVGADDVGIYGLRFTATITAVVIGLSVETLATDLVVSDCLFDVETTATDEFLITIILAVGCDRFTIENSVIDQGLGGAATGIKLIDLQTGGNIRGNRIVGAYSLANIAGITNASLEIYIEENLLFNGGSAAVTAKPVISMNGNTTGVVRRNTFFCNVATIVLQSVSAAQAFSENYAGEDMGAAFENILRHGATSVVASADG